MPVLKTQCPECYAKLRLSVDGAGDHETECPKCGRAFTAALDGDDLPEQTRKPKKADRDEITEKADKGPKEKAKAKDAKSGQKAKTTTRRDDDEDDAPKKKRRPDDEKASGKAKRRAEEDEDDEDDAPRKNRRRNEDEDDETGGGKTKLIVAGAVVAVLLLCGVGGAIYAFTGKKKTDPPAETAQQSAPAGPTAPIKADPNQNPNANTQPNTGPKPPTSTPAPPPPGPQKDPQETELATAVPAPPKIRISGSAIPDSKPVVRPPAIPPLAPDEDPFNRAKEFKQEGVLPVLPLLPVKDRPLLTLEAGGHTDAIGKVFFTPKGDRVVTISRDKAVRIWDPTTNETSKMIRFPAGPGREGSLQAAAISCTGQRLAVSGAPLAGVLPGKIPIYIVSPDTGAQIKRLDVASGPVLSMHFSIDGKWLGVGTETGPRGDTGAVQLIEVANGHTTTVPCPAPVIEVKFNPNPKLQLLATLGADSYVQIWNFQNKGGNKDIPVHKQSPTTLAWSNIGRTLAIGTMSGEIKLWTSEGKEITTLPKLTADGKPVQIRHIRYLPGDAELVVAGHAGAKGWAGIVNEQTGAVRTKFLQHNNVIFALDVSPDGTRIATSGGSQHETFVWSADDGKVLNRFVGGGTGVWSLGWSKDGKSLAWGTSNVRNENGEGKLEGTFRLDELGVGDPPDPSKYVQLVASDDHVKIKSGKIGFMFQTTGRELDYMRLNDGEPVYAATVLPNANAVVVAGAETLAMFNPATRKSTRKFIGHTGNILCVTPSPDGRLFATGSSDQTIRIWRPDQEDPILSIFVAGHDWIAWTPQGFYACSGQGERLIAWQIGAGPGKTPVVMPAERFRASMYQPALLKYVVPAGDLPRALAMAQKYDKALISTTNVADVLPPEVTLEGFETAEVKVEKDALTVRASAKCANAKHQVTAMRLLVDGRPYQGAAGVKRFENLQPGTDATASWEVPLAPGTHTVAVIADSPVSKGMSKIGIAVRSGDPPKPNLYVLAIGISDYPGKLKLHYCATDAEMLAKAFKQHSKNVFANIEVKLLTDKAATKKGILDGLDWLKSKMTAQDVGIVSISSHGTRDLFGQFYLCPVDLDPTDEECKTCLSGKLFKDRLDEMPGRLVAILDACHSGAVAEKGPPPTETLVRDLTAEDSGVIVMCASGGREYANESPLTKAGFYTLGLVEGMSGYGDIDGDGVVYLHELDIYATARVRQLSGGRQNPTLGRPQSIRPFVIAKPDNPPKP